MPKRRHRGQERRIALERIAILLRLAEREAVQRHADRARRYVDLARKIGMRYNVRMPTEFRRHYCKDCGAYLVPSVNARVRVGRGHLVITCTGCGAIQRLPYRKEQAAVREARRPSAPS